MHFLFGGFIFNEKQGSTFAHFLYFPNPIDPLNQLCNVFLCDVYIPGAFSFKIISGLIQVVTV